MKSSDVPDVFSNIPVPDYRLTEAVEGPPIRKRKVALVGRSMKKNIENSLLNATTSFSFLDSDTKTVRV